MKGFKTKILILCVALLTFGCQNAGVHVGSSQSLFCTTCKSETKTTYIKGLYNKSFTCPKCDNKVGYDTWGEDLPLHICKSCGRALEKCPICRDQKRYR